MNRSILIAAAAATLGLAGFFAGEAASQSGPTPTRIGYLDVKLVFDGYWKKSEVEKTLITHSNALSAKIQNEYGRLDGIADELATLSKTTDEYAKKARELEVGRYSIKLDEESGMRNLARKAQEQEALIYKEIVREARAYGESRGFAAIMLKRPLQEGFEKTANLDELVPGRAVIWNHDSLDVTNDVLSLLNASRPPTPK